MAKALKIGFHALAAAAVSFALVAAIPGNALAYQMSDADRRLNVAVVGFELNEAGAEDALQAGADINHRNDAMDNDTMLITAIRSFKDLSVVKWLLDHGADPSLTNELGRNALSYAKQYKIGNTPAGRAIMKLLEGGAGAGAGAAGAVPAAPTATQPEPPQAPTVYLGAAQGIDPITGRGFAEPPPSSGPVGGPPPAPGVYESYGQSAMMDPQAFGIIDGSSYMNAMGKRGRYSYDSRSGVLTLVQGGKPARYQRISATTFRVITPSGALGGFVCPLNRAKNPQRPPW